MPSAERAIDRGSALAWRQLRELGAEFRERRMSLGHSQSFVAAAARISRPRLSAVEAGHVPTLSVSELNRIAGVLGLATSVRLYPGGAPTRDAAHGGKLGALLRQAQPPLSYRLEVALPAVDGRLERRAWDAVLFGGGERTAVELEMRLQDVQAMLRRHALKRRDDPTEHFLLLIADTRHNRRVVAEFDDLFTDLSRLRPSVVKAALEAGEHPPTGRLLV